MLLKGLALPKRLGDHDVSHVPCSSFLGLGVKSQIRVKKNVSTSRQIFAVAWSLDPPLGPQDRRMVPG